MNHGPGVARLVHRLVVVVKRPKEHFAGAFTVFEVITMPDNAHGIRLMKGRDHFDRGLSKKRGLLSHGASPPRPWAFLEASCRGCPSHTRPPS